MKASKPGSYERGRIAIDVVILTIKDQKLFVYLNTREKEPFKSLAELPGGLLLTHEAAEQTLARKLKDVIGVEDIFFQQFYTFTEPNRDPRGRTISIGFIALVPEDKVKNANNFYTLTNFPKLAFDHQKIIEEAITYLKQNTDNQIVKHFMPAYFPLNDLQRVYEIIRQRKLDNRNFRKSILDSGIIEDTGKIQQNVAHRPASLFRYISDNKGRA